MQISQLKDLVEIARAGSFRKAAARLNKSQPALTRSITLLEEELGLALFRRTTSGATLTKDGGHILQRARTVLAETERLTDEAAQIRNQQRGTVRVGVSPVGGTLILPQALPRFRKDWSGIDLEILNVLYPEALGLLRDGQLDLIIGPMPQKVDSTSYEVRNLLDMRLVVVAKAESRFSSSTRLSQITDANWLVHGPAEGPSEVFSGFSKQEPEIGPTSLTRCHSLSTLLEILATGDDLAFLSDKIFERFGPQYGLCRLPIEDALPKVTLTLAWRRDIPLTPAADRMAQLILRRSAETGE